MRPVTLQLPDATATEELGGALARAFPGATRHGLVVHLEGDLGAGKSALVRAFLQACGVAGPIRSPTYTLMETHPSEAATFVHVDLYRLSPGEDLEELGLRDQSGPGFVLLVEWPERALAALPRADLSIKLDYVNPGRRVTLSSRGASGEAWVSLLVSDRRIIPYLINLT